MFFSVALNLMTNVDDNKTCEGKALFKLLTDASLFSSPPSRRRAVQVVILNSNLKRLLPDMSDTLQSPQCSAAPEILQKSPLHLSHAQWLICILSWYFRTTSIFHFQSRKGYLEVVSWHNCQCYNFNVHAKDHSLYPEKVSTLGVSIPVY